LLDPQPLLAPVEVKRFGRQLMETYRECRWNGGQWRRCETGRVLAGEHAEASLLSRSPSPPAPAAAAAAAAEAMVLHRSILTSRSMSARTVAPP